MSNSNNTPPPKPTWVLPYVTENLRELYTLGTKLGQGQFGTTYLCTHNPTGRTYACKSIPKKKLLCKEDYDDVWREIQIMHHLSEHPNVVRIHGTYEDSFSVHLVMELCKGGELFDRIVKKGHYSEREAAKLIRTIVEVVENCHSLGVMHRDLKPENFLFDTVEEDAVLKTTDFGLSAFYKPGEIFSDVVGSPYYVAPEVLHKHYGPEADVWSAGVILYILLSGVPPFWAETEQGIFRQILQGRLDFQSEPWPGISDSAKDLIRKMLDRNPKTRFTAHQVLCHPWIVDDNIAPDKPLDSAVLTRLKQFSAMNKLKKMALRVIAERLSEEEIGGLKELFRMLDADSSGTITLDELKEGLKRVGSELMESEIKDLMDAGQFEIISLSAQLVESVDGSGCKRMSSLKVSVEGPDSRLLGGVVGDKLIAASTVKALGDLVESCIGVVLLDSGFDLNKVWKIMTLFLDPIMKFSSSLQLSPVRDLQELCQSHNLKLQLLTSKLAKTFSVEAKVTGDGVCEKVNATSQNKKEATRIASQLLFSKLKAQGLKLKSKTLEDVMKSTFKAEPELIGYDETPIDVTDTTTIGQVMVNGDLCNKANPEIRPIQVVSADASSSSLKPVVQRLQSSPKGKLSETIQNCDCVSGSSKTAKSRLYELCQSYCWKALSFECCKEEGPDHLKLFTCKATLTIEETPDTVFEFVGEPLPKKKDATDSAAEGALWYLQKEGYLHNANGN